MVARMASSKASRAPDRGGRPTKYQARFCRDLVDHLRRGYTFESFGAVAGVSRATLFNWERRHKAFREAHALGGPLSELFYLQMGQKLAPGQLRRVLSEAPMLDKHNRPIPDPARPGQYLMSRVYAPATGNAPVWIFMMKNMHGWRDKRDVNHGGQEGNPVEHRHVEMTREQRAAEIKRLAALREATDP